MLLCARGLRATVPVAAAASIASTTRARAEDDASSATPVVAVDASTSSRNHYDHVIVGCGVGGTAALKAVSTRAASLSSLLVVDSDPAAIARCRALARHAQCSVACVRDRVASLHPGQQTLTTSATGDITYGRCLLASGSPAPAPPPGFVDRGARAAVRVLGLGETHDAAAAAEAAAVARAGGHVVVLGGSRRATSLVADVCAVWRPVDATADCVAEEGPAATLIFPEATPLGARLPKALGRRLARRLEKRGASILALNQVRHIGAAHGGGAWVYLGRSDDPMKTSRRRADLVIVAGGEHFVPPHTPTTVVRRDTVAELGATSMSAARPTVLGGGPVWVSEELAACQSVLSCGDAAATPCRLRASPVARSRAAASLAAEAGTWHAQATGAAAGAALVDGDAAAAASVVDELTPRLVVDLGAGVSAAFIGRCDATLENRASDAGKGATVAVYVDRSDELASPVGAVVFTVGSGELDAAAAAVDDALRSVDTAPEGVAAAAFAALGAGEPSLRHARTMGSRADRLGPRVADRSSSVLFSRDVMSEVVKDRADKAYARGWLHGPGSALTEAETVRANAEASLRRRATVTAPREPAVDWLELADRRVAGAASGASCV